MCIGLVSPPQTLVSYWFLIVAAISLITTLLWMCIHFLGINDAVTEPIVIEFWHIGLIAFANITAFVLQLAGWSSAMWRDSEGGRNVVAGVSNVDDCRSSVWYSQSVL